MLFFHVLHFLYLEREDNTAYLYIVDHAQHITRAQQMGAITEHGKCQGGEEA